MPRVMNRHAHFVIYRDKAGEWRWRLFSANNRIVADSGEAYVTEYKARRALKTATATAVLAEKMPAGLVK